jgi:hypothetical protein
MSDEMNEQQGNEPLESGAPVRKGHKKGFNAWWEERSFPEKVLLVIGMILLAIAFAALFGLVVMLLWNWLMPEIFGLKQVNFWQAVGLTVLSWILFKGNMSSSNSGSRSTDRKRKQQLRRAMEDSQGPAGQE